MSTQTVPVPQAAVPTPVATPLGVTGNDTTRRVTTQTLHEMKAAGTRIAMLTAYDYTSARLLDAAGVDVLLVGDSASNVMAGHETTLPITLDQMVYHAQCVVRGVTRALVVVDLPFGSYQGNSREALASAIRVMKETGAHAIKLEGGREVAESVKRILDAGIPVMGHLGLTPQSIYQFGTYRVRARENDEADALREDVRLLDEAGVFAVVLEKIPAALGRETHRGHARADDRHRGGAGLFGPGARHPRPARADQGVPPALRPPLRRPRRHRRRSGRALRLGRPRRDVPERGGELLEGQGHGDWITPPGPSPRSTRPDPHPRPRPMSDVLDAPADRPLILLCNDDGIDAAGINALACALDGLGTLVVVAPFEEQSAVGHAITVRMPMRVHPWTFDGACGPLWARAVTGTPADCVKIAVQKLLPRRPDLVVSGINHGPNTAVSVMYSGTVSAATEATILGIPAVAVSHGDWRPTDFTAAGEAARTRRRARPRRGPARRACCSTSTSPAGRSRAGARRGRAARAGTRSSRSAATPSTVPTSGSAAPSSTSTAATTRTRRPSTPASSP